MLFLKRAAIAVVIPLIGAVIVAGLEVARVGGVFIGWESIGIPPQAATSLIVTGEGVWANTGLGQVFQFSSDSECPEGCWLPSEAPDPNGDGRFYIPPEQCGWRPSLAGAVDTQAICEIWGIGTSFTVYALRDDGETFKWRKLRGESDTLGLIYSPFIGAILGLVVDAILLYFMVMSTLGKRASRANGRATHDEVALK